MRKSLLVVGLLLLPSVAIAQAPPPPTGGPPPPGGPPPTGTPPPGDQWAAASAPQPVKEKPTDGVRFRGGISAGGGFAVYSFTGSSLTAYLGGVDGHLGVQINHLFAVYAVPHLSFGVINTSTGSVSISNATGVAAASAVGELTLFHRLFVAAGFGGGVLNNPAGPMLHFRLGGYPVQGFGDNGIRRQGLMVGADLRIIFASQGASSIVAVQPMFSIGYEAF